MTEHRTERPMGHAQAIADAVLYEGYLLYPYRASAAKNRLRWQFGVLVPPAYEATGTGEYAGMRTECLLEPGPEAVLHLRLRFLQLATRLADTAGPGPGPDWDEAVTRELDVVAPVADLAADGPAGGYHAPVRVPGGTDSTDGVQRRRQELHGRVRLRTEPLPGPYPAVRLRVDVTNSSGWSTPQPSREQALRHSLVAAHLLLVVEGGQFLSLLDPPEWARPAAQQCVNERTWPVLVGPPGRRDTMLSSPIILYDHPEVAAESPGDLFDGTEIDELLSLRTLTLTDAEKQEARATDPRAAELIDRVESLPPELLERLHGAIRSVRPVADPDPVPAPAPEPATGTPWWAPGEDRAVDPETDHVEIAGRRVARGSTVRLAPGARRTDAQDMFLIGRSATVQAVFGDVDGRHYLAVTLDDDPGADLHLAHGRFRYFAPDEVEPMPDPSPAPDSGGWTG